MVFSAQVCKPSEMTSVTAWMLCSILNEAGNSLNYITNKKQGSRQLQCEVPCAGNVVNSSLSLSSTSHAVHRGGGWVWRGVRVGGG